MVKTITVTDEAYLALRLRKGDRSFSEVLIEEFEPRRCTGRDLLKIMESTPPISEDEYQKLKASHAKFKRDFSRQLAERRKRLWKP